MRLKPRQPSPSRPSRGVSGAVQHCSVTQVWDIVESSVVAIQIMISQPCKLWLAVSKEVSCMTFVSSGNN